MGRGAISQPAFMRRQSRFGPPEDFAALVQACHEAGLGVILDWVPGHFPDEPHGLANSDGTALCRTRRTGGRDGTSIGTR